ncbi:hypothetical protein KW817_24145, partial [Enterobacter quasiroggenkampii]|uniref:hypothetical protein n=1 Tax=Enterobacter quasiroggenkampii TaxID=2497436 RepID=UPI0021CFCF15
FMSLAAVAARKAGVDLADTRYLLSQHVYANAFNLTVKNLLSYCVTIDYDTMMEIYQHENFKPITAWSNLYPSCYDEEGYDKADVAYQLISQLFNNPRPSNNPVVMSVLDHTLNM